MILNNFMLKKGSIFLTAILFFILTVAGCDSPVSPGTHPDHISKQEVMQLAQKHGLEIKVVKDSDRLNASVPKVSSISKLDKIFAYVSKLSGKTIKKMVQNKNLINKKVVNGVGEVASSAVAGCVDYPNDNQFCAKTPFWDAWLHVDISWNQGLTINPINTWMTDIKYDFYYQQLRFSTFPSAPIDYDLSYDVVGGLFATTSSGDTYRILTIRSGGYLDFNSETGTFDRI